MGEIIRTYNQSELIDAVKNNDSVVLKALYSSGYPKTEFLVLSNKGTKEDAKDVYQEAFIVVWNTIKNGSFIPLNETAVQGYLYTISKNKWMDIIKSSRFKKTSLAVEDKSLINKSDDSKDPNQEDFLDEKLNKTMQAFKNMGQPCKQLLTDFYYEKKSLKDIAIQLNIEESTVRNKKYRCMENLRALLIPQINLNKSGK